MPLSRLPPALSRSSSTRRGSAPRPRALGKRSSEVNAGRRRALAYYEWIRARLQALIAERQLAQVRATLGRCGRSPRRSGCRSADLHARRVAGGAGRADRRSAAPARRAARGAAAPADRRRPTTSRSRSARTSAPTCTAPAARPLDDARRRTATAPAPRVPERSTSASRRRRSSARPSTRTSYPQLSAFATGRLREPEPARLPAGGQVQLHVGGRRAADVDAQRARSSRARTTRRIARRDRRARAPTARTSSAARGSSARRRSRPSQLAQHALATSQKGLAAAEEGYRVRRELLNAERATAVELVDAETELTRARIAALNARVDLRVAMAQLRHALGDTTYEVAGRADTCRDSVQAGGA